MRWRHGGSADRAIGLGDHMGGPGGGAKYEKAGATYGETAMAPSPGAGGCAGGGAGAIAGAGADGSGTPSWPSASMHSRSACVSHGGVMPPEAGAPLVPAAPPSAVAVAAAALAAAAAAANAAADAAASAGCTAARCRR